MSYASSPSNVSAVTGDGTAIKITLERQKEHEMRRVRGNFSFPELVSVVRHMWNSAPKRLTIEYEDEDGDRVRVGSDLEWAEAQRQCGERGQRVLRLFARRTRKANGPTATSGPAESASDSEADEDVSPAIVPARGSAAIPPLDVTQAQRDCPADPLPEVTRSGTPCDEEPKAMGNPQMSETSTEGTPEHENTIELLSRLFDCDAAKEMQDMFTRINFSPVVTRKVDAVANEVIVDVDRTALRHLTVTRTNLWIGNSLYEKAESTLDVAMQVWPEDSLFEYNAACSAALRGDLTKAMSLLSDAVSHGYRNAKQLQQDPDLQNVRDHPDFGALLRSARSETIVVDDEPEATPTAPVPTAPAPTAPVAAPSTETDVDKLVAVFPHMTAAEAASVLQRCGNLTVAVNHCLANM